MPLAALATKLKRLEVGERLVRRNPLYYSVAQRELARVQRADARTRSAWMQERLRRVLSVASETAYGRSVGAPRNISDWPLLCKESVAISPMPSSAARVGGETCSTLTPRLAARPVCR